MTRIQTLSLSLFCMVLCLSLTGVSKSHAAGKPSNPVTQLLASMKTDRGGFGPEEVSLGEIKSILDSGVNTPSAQNKQPWYFTVVTSKPVLEQIRRASQEDMMKRGGPGALDTMDNAEAATTDKMGKKREDANANRMERRPDGTRNPSQGNPPDDKGGMKPMMRDVLENAPLVIIISGTRDWKWSTFDCALACANMFIAAKSLGLGAHIVMGPVDTLNGDKSNEFRKLLKFPEDKVPQVMLLIGRPGKGADGTSQASTRNPNVFSIIQ